MTDTDPEARTISAAFSAGEPVVRATLDEGPTLLAGRYELLGLLGSGAMGTVYSALDRELDETVALKVLKRELASADMLERFRREVKLARRVTHRNVARTYDIGEDGGDRFLTMEFIEGEMLGSLLGRRGRLPVSEVVRLALDVCAGLGAAHAANVLHRDLKPENVIIAKDGRAVITDFGIARAAILEGGGSHTANGIVGTPAYMAPEQVEGRADLDARTDLYALGAMLYELLTGQLAWQGDSVITIAAGRLLRPPPDPRAVTASLPDPVAELVLSLMARRPEEWPDSAADVAQRLEALTEIPPRPLSSRSMPVAASVEPGRPEKGAKSVAVLPILNLGTSDDRYLVDNVVEDLVDLLSMVPGLLVRPRGDTARFLDGSRDVREIGRLVGADVVIDGSLRRIGDSVRASFRLIAVEDGFQLWARRFDRAPADLLSIADDAAHAIAKALTTELGARKTRTIDPRAEELFLRGRFLMQRGWHEAMAEASEVLEKALAYAPDDPRILGTFALSLARIYGGPGKGREIAERARSLAERATALDSVQPEAKVALAILHLQNQECDAAVRYFRQALALAPTSVDALDWLGRIMVEVGRIEQGLAHLRHALAIDPEHAQVRHQIARTEGVLGDANAMARSMGALPTHPGDLAQWFMFHARDVMWRRDRAGAEQLEAALARATVSENARFSIENLLKMALGRGQSVAEGDFLDTFLPVDRSRTPRRAAFNAQLRAECYAFLADTSRTLEALRAADANALIDITWMDRCPLFAPLHAHPDFITVRERVALRARRVIDAFDS